MSNTKHTPGPWQFAMGGVTKDWPQVESPTGALIARTYDVNAEDNARLIAAAPAMLEALRIALENAWVISDHDCAMPRVDFDALLAAFTQAGGELT
jgi:hypothetical protein